MRSPRVACLVSLVALVAACSGSAVAPTLDGREYLSTTITEGGVERQLLPGTRISLRFGEGRIGASVGCNQFGATYRLDGVRLVTDGGAITEMGCDQPRHAQDDWLFGFLGAGPSVAVTGPQLVLSDGSTVIALLDREVALPDLALAGPAWRVESIVRGEAVSSVPEQVVATLRFDPAGRVVIETGCNSGGADVAVGPAVLRFTGVTITEASCEAPFGELEHPMLQVLGANEVSYRIDADVLHLEAGDAGLQLRAM
jgi:heat shock protein HslJ